MDKAELEPDFGEGLLEGLREAVAWKKGEVALQTVNLDPMPPERIRAIRKRVGQVQAAGGAGCQCYQVLQTAHLELAAVEEHLQ